MRDNDDYDDGRTRSVRLRVFGRVDHINPVRRANETLSQKRARARARRTVVRHSTKRTTNDDDLTLFGALAGIRDARALVAGLISRFSQRIFSFRAYFSGYPRFRAYSLLL